MPGSVQFVAGTTSAQTTATSISSSLPTGLQDGDEVVAFVFARSAVSTPAGWELVAATTTSIGQSISLYRKVQVVSSDSGASTTWVQASSARIGVTYGAFRNGKVAAFTTVKADGNGDNKIALPALTSTLDGAMFIGGATIYYSTTSPPVAPSATGGFTLWSGYHPTEATRVVGARKAASAGETLNATLDLWPNSSSTTNYSAAIAAVLYPPWVISGVVKDDSGVPVQRTVRSYRRDTGQFDGETQSDATTGAYTLEVFGAVERQVVCLDDDAGTPHNDLLLRVLPP